jgi:transcriptional regulator with XRE-family HTH domain
MGDASYVVVGKGNRLSLNSAPHGAGRAFSRSIVAIASAFDADADELLTAAGKPPLEQARSVIAADPHGSLPMRLNAWRDSNGYTTAEAAYIVGINRWEFSKLAAGSMRPQSDVRIQMLADALRLHPLTVIDAAYGPDSQEKVAVALRRNFAVAPCLIHRGLREARLRHYDGSDLALAGKALGMSAQKLRHLATGTVEPSLQDALKLHQRFGVPIAELMSAVGVDTALATRWEQAAKTAPRPGPVESVGQLLRAYRTVADRPLASVAKAAGYTQHTALLRVENDDHLPSPQILTRLADTLRMPLPRLFAAAKLTPARAITA